MSAFKVYGSSDDVLVIEGDVTDEFYPRRIEEDYRSSNRAGYLCMSDGTVLHVRYDNEGMWRLSTWAQGQSAITHQAATDPDSDYSDTVQVDGPVSWVVLADCAPVRIKSRRGPR